MSRIKTYKTKAVSDTNFFRNQSLRNDLISNGWTETQMKRHNSKEFVDEPFLIFHREIPIKNIKKIDDALEIKILSPKSEKSQNAVGADKQAVSTPSETSGAKTTMGVPIGCACPPGQSTDYCLETKSPAVSSLSDIKTIQRMRLSEKSFVIGFDTEFYYDKSGCRNILSWQFAFITPEKPDFIQEILVFGEKEDKTLPFSYILNYIISNFNIYATMGKDNSDNSGFSYFRTHRWRVPVKNKKGLIRAKDFSNFDEAVDACCNPMLQKELKSVGMWKKADVIITEGVAGYETHYSYEIDGYPVGYLNIYTEADKHAVDVTLVCHTGSADISTLNFDNKYEKDILLRLSQIQGGLMTLKPYYMHNPCLEKYKNFYPVRLSVRDTMGFAPSKKKSLKSLGDTIGVPKLEVQKPFTKSDMLSYMLGDTIAFSEYAINDSVIALLYSAELWGVNTSMPVTVSSAAGRAAVPVIKEHFGLSETDDAGYNLKYRGLKTVKKGLTAKNFGFLENTNLEPLDFDCEMLQQFAKNSYKGGYNGCSAPGYYTEITNDFDLENAYPSCMALVPDVDWENCIAYDTRNIVLTQSMIRNPFEPIFAVIDFEFPESVKYPCLPVSVDGCMIFPRSNKGEAAVYASAPEIYLALKLGCKITAKKLIIGNVLSGSDGKPSNCLLSVVRQFVNDRNIAKDVFGKGSLADLLIKEAVNSIYGKTAQDVIDKTSWSAMDEEMVSIGASQITSPYHSCITTAGVRCVLLAAMNQLENLGYKVYSVTTDGFISNADYDTLVNLDLYGFTDLFCSSRMALVGDPTMWAIKHSQNDLLNLTTRGNASLIVGDSKKGVLPGVLAHNSFVTGEVPDSYADRFSFITQCLSRTDRLRTINASFVKFKEMARFENRLDFAVHDQERLISMDFDMKRKPVQESLQNVNVIINSVSYQIANVDTVPYETISEYISFKTIARNMKVLRSFEDWCLFFDKICSRSDGYHRKVTDLEWSILFSAVMAVRLQVPLQFLNGEAAAVPFLMSAENSVDDKVEWINKFNKSSKQFTVNTWKDCRKQTRLSQMLPEQVFEAKVREMLEWNFTDDDGHASCDPIDYNELYCSELPKDYT